MWSTESGPLRIITPPNNEISGTMFGCKITRAHAFRQWATCKNPSTIALSKARSTRLPRHRHFLFLFGTRSAGLAGNPVNRHGATGQLSSRLDVTVDDVARCRRRQPIARFGQINHKSCPLLADADVDQRRLMLGRCNAVDGPHARPPETASSSS